MNGSEADLLAFAACWKLARARGKDPAAYLTAMINGRRFETERGRYAQRWEDQGRRLLGDLRRAGASLGTASDGERQAAALRAFAHQRGENDAA
ncbi:MAG: hypothetical protein HC841_00380 [Verrucomicrobiae bacterium]|nr:hypothetical protein [Verrucomicrobiae bacterium]